MKIELKNINKKYNDRIIFHNLSISILSNGLYVLTGPNGIGKTTLFNILSYDDTDFKGKIYLNNKLIRPKEIPNYKEKIIGYSHQINYFLPDETVLSNLQTLFDASYNAQIDKILNLVYTEDIKTRLYGDLSDGEKNRLNITVTLIKNSPIMLFDEAFNYLDRITAIKIINYLKEIKFNHIIVFTTHDNLSNLELSEFQDIKLDTILNSKETTYQFSYSNENSSEVLPSDKSSKNGIKKLFKKSRPIIIFSFIFNLIFGTALAYTTSIYNQSSESNINTVTNKYIYNNYSIANYIELDDFENSIYVEKFYFQNNLLNTIPSLTQSPIFYNYNSNIPYELILGKDSENENELIISSYNYNKLLDNDIIQSFNDLENLKIIDSKKIVGVYQSTIDYGPKAYYHFLENNNFNLQYQNPMESYMTTGTICNLSYETASKIFNKEPYKFYVNLRSVQFNKIKSEKAPSIRVFKDNGENFLMNDLLSKIDNITTPVFYVLLFIVLLVNLAIIALTFLYTSKTLLLKKINGESKQNLFISITCLSIVEFIPIIISFIIGLFISNPINTLLTNSIILTNPFVLFEMNSALYCILPIIFICLILLTLLCFRKTISQSVITIYKNN